MKFWMLWVCVMAGYFPTGYAQTITLTIPMTMGSIEFANPVTGTVEMATNGSMRYGNGLSGVANGVPGVFIVAQPGNQGVDVDISCAATATLAHSSGVTISMTPTLTIRRGQNFSNSVECLGLGNIIHTMRLRSNANNNDVYIGGELFPAGTSLTSGTYNTTNAGGVPVVVQVVVQ